MVMLAEAYRPPEIVLVAVIVSVVGALTLLGAGYKPLLESMPAPESDQFTLVLLTPVSCALNCFVWPAIMLAEAGEIEIVSGFSVIVPEACNPLTAALVAVTVAVLAAVTVVGAV
jgi:hypothetical protein